MTGPKDTLLHVRDLRKSFGPKHTLQGLNLDIARGESVVVIGGSGTGKSVLVKCITGLMEPDSGSMMFDGEELVGMSRRRREELMRRFGLQGGALFDSLSVAENVAFGPVESRVSRREGRDIAAEMLAKVGLGPDILERYPAEISVGMQKRVSLARTIATQPDMLFFDEPTTGLDPIMADVIDDLIRHAVADLGASALTITHDMSSARVVGDRIAMLYGGSLVWDGPASEIDTADNAYVHQFVNGLADGPITDDLRRRWRREGMAKATQRFVCQDCGAVYPRWTGKCDSCGGWNTVTEEVTESAPKGLGTKPGRRIDFVSLEEKQAPRLRSGIEEFDRVLGGGLVLGAAVLIGGDPGIGKSTLLLQVVTRLAAGGRCAYVSGEEALDQIGPRRPARRGPGAGGPRRRDQCPRHRGDTRLSGRARCGRDRLDPDDVRGHDRERAGHSEPGTRLRPGADPGC